MDVDVDEGGHQELAVESEEEVVISDLLEF